MRHRSLRFTLLEMAIVIALVSIIAAIAWSSTRNQMPRYRLQNAGKLLRSDVVRVRNEAIFSGRETRILFTGSGGSCDGATPTAGRWLLQIGDGAAGSTRWDTFPPDMESDGTDDDGGQGTIDLTTGDREAKMICLRDWGALGAGSSVDAIVFNTRGWVTNPNDDYVAGFIGVTLVNVDAKLQGQVEEVDLLVGKAGMTQLQTRYP